MAYMAVKSLSALLRGMKQKDDGDFYCLNYFPSFRTKNVLKKDHAYCYVIKIIKMPNKDNNILRYNDGGNFMKAPFIIYGDIEFLLEKISTCYNNPNESSIVKIIINPRGK